MKWGKGNARRGNDRFIMMRRHQINDFVYPQRGLRGPDWRCGGGRHAEQFAAAGTGAGLAGRGISRPDLRAALGTGEADHGDIFLLRLSATKIRLSCSLFIQ